MPRARGGAPSAPAITLAWLVRLRWGAVVGQVLAIALGRTVLGLDLPLAALGGLVAVTALTNVALVAWLARSPDVALRVPGAVLSLDTLVLTGRLYYSGGPSNPFSVLYLVHVTLAAVVLGMRWAGFMVVLTAVSYAVLFVAHRPLAGMEHAHHQGHPSFSAHLQAMWVAFTVAAALIAFFVARLASALRSRERELAEAQRVAARAEKLVSLTTLAAGAAHELGTPLATIAVASKELARSIRQTPDEAVEDARLIREEVDRCRAILKRMSADAGEAMGEAPEHVTGRELLDRCAKRLGSVEDVAARLKVNAADDVALECLADGLVQVLVSLVHNAFHASRAASAPVMLSVRDAGDVVRFVVEDHGTGIPREIVHRLGEPFFTTKPPGEGMGLGLFLAHAFVARCRGRIDLDSAEGRGTVVTLELPRTMELALER
jgi:two-component system, sensor histidine kinase RegB